MTALRDALAWRRVLLYKYTLSCLLGRAACSVGKGTSFGLVIFATHSGWLGHLFCIAITFDSIS